MCSVIQIIAKLATTLGNEFQDGVSLNQYAVGTFEGEDFPLGPRTVSYFHSDPLAAAALDQHTLHRMSLSNHCSQGNKGSTDLASGYSAQPGSLHLGMEHSANLESGAFNFLTSYLANTSATTSGLGDTNVDNSSPSLENQLHNAGSTYALSHLAPVVASSPPTPVEESVAMEKKGTRKRKSEVDVNDIIPGGRGSRPRTKNPKVRADI